MTKTRSVANDLAIRTRLILDILAAFIMNFDFLSADQHLDEAEGGSSDFIQF
jgi:hypothetical protein